MDPDQKEQSDQDQHYLPSRQYLMDTLHSGETTLFKFQDNLNFLSVQNNFYRNIIICLSF